MFSFCSFFFEAAKKFLYLAKTTKKYQHKEKNCSFVVKGGWL